MYCFVNRRTAIDRIYLYWRALCSFALLTSCGGSTAPHGADAAALEAGGAEGGGTLADGAEAGSCNISTDDYSQSCSLDSDCIGTLANGFPIESGNFCSPTMCFCGGRPSTRARCRNSPRKACQML